ncbi:arylesterase [Roseitranquillus sediminis]|uniref:arylesterase n=1 Tax=Roseitranquillus sediminis TaxID=2809051 RepID=UPI0038735AB5
MRRSAEVPKAYGLLRNTRNAGLVAVLAGAAQAETVIAALGDSLTQGYGLPQEQGLVPQLQEWLDARGAEARVLNAGVSGDTTAGGLSRVEWTLTDEVDAMIVALGGNDILRGIDPAVSRDNIDGILGAAEAAEVEVLLVGVEAPGNYGADYKAAFDRLYVDLSEEYGTLLVESFFAPLEASGDRDTAMQAYMQPDGLHPNAAGVELIVEALGPSVLELIDRTESSAPVEEAGAGAGQ